MPWIVYCHTHITTGRHYIGLTSKTMLQRWNQHVLDSKHKAGKRCSYFWNAIRKYGKDAFTHQVLEFDIQTLEEANDAERAWISSFSSWHRDFGFNLMRGGGHASTASRSNPWDRPEYRARNIAMVKNLWKDPIYRAKNRAANQAALRTPEARARMSAIIKEVSSKPEVRAKNSAAHKGKSPNAEHRARISETIMGMIPSPKTAAYFERRKEQARQKELFTTWTCTVHGPVPVTECYRTLQGGYVRFRCKICTKERVARRHQLQHQ